MEAGQTFSSNISTGGASGGDDLATSWLTRIQKSTEYYKKWAQRMKCEKLESYYLGEQWEPSGTNYEPYVLNLVFSSIEIKLPTLLFQNPVFHVSPRPGGMEWDIEGSVQRAILRESLLNSLVNEQSVDFGEEIETSVLDAHFRFGIIEVGFDANWINNPNAGKPILRSDSKPVTDRDGNVIKQPEKLPEDERVYVKRVNPRHFRVGGLDGSRLERCNWVGYWDFERIEDLVANKELKNRDQLKWAGGRSSDFVPDEYGMEINDLVSSGDLCKIWKVWDIRKKKRYIFADPQGVTLLDEPFKRLPLFGLKFHKNPKGGWYPLPPVTNWKPAQDEYNEAREQARNHRKRFTRKFLYAKAKFTTEEEVDKLINGGDGSFCGVDGNLDPNTVLPVQNASLDASSTQALMVSKDDFNIISGTSEEQRGQADRTTATQANLINQKAQIRDSKSRITVANWLMQIGEEILLLAEEKLTLPVWIKLTTPPPTQETNQIVVGGQNFSLPTGASQIKSEAVWKQIHMEDLKAKDSNGDSVDDLGFDVKISLDSMSPVANDEEKNKFLLFLSTLSQFPEITSDPVLVRETAYKLGYYNEEVISRIALAAQYMLVGKLSQLMGPSSGGGGNPGQGGPQQNQIAQGMVAQNTPPNLEQIRQQTQNQIPGVQ